MEGLYGEGQKSSIPNIIDWFLIFEFFLHNDCLDTRRCMPHSRADECKSTISISPTSILLVISILPIRVDIQMRADASITIQQPGADARFLSCCRQPPNKMVHDAELECISRFSRCKIFLIGRGRIERCYYDYEKQLFLSHQNALR